MKKILSFMFVSLVIVLLVGCNFRGSAVTKADLLKSNEDVLGFSAVTTVKALSAMFVMEAPVVEETAPEATAPEAPVVEETAPEATAPEAPAVLEVEPYLALIKSLKGNAGFAVAETASDNLDYQVLMSITITDVNGNPLEYKFYFNETVIDEEESSIEGIMLIGGTTYFLEGKKEKEVDEDESEESLELKAYIDEFNYCLLTYEVETEDDEIEKEFKYSLYQDGVLVQSIRIEFEEEEGETEIKLIFTENTTTRIYKFEIEENIEVSYKVIEDGVIVESGKSIITITQDENGKDVITYVVDSDDDDNDSEVSHKYDSDDDNDEEEDDDDNEEEDN